jgi:uncharacterized protein
VLNKKVELKTDQYMATALITGATSGFGRVFCELFAADGHDLVINSRHQQDLDQLKQEIEGRYQVQVTPIEKDFTRDDAAQEMYNEIKAKGITIEYLVNNVGFGDVSYFAEEKWEKARDMVQVNITALTQLTYLYLPEMLQRNSGRILNLASIVSLIPTPKMAVYAATKAYVLSFTEALIQEVKDSKVTITALLPGASDTEFFERAHGEHTRIVQETDLQDARKVAKDGYEAMMKGENRIISGVKTKMQAYMSNVLPDSLMAAGMGKLMEEENKRRAA